MYRYSRGVDDAERDARDAELLRDLADAPLLSEREINRLHLQRDTLLAPAERRALVCASHGLSTKMVAQLLCLDQETIKTQLATARYKLRAKNTAHACCQALRLGLID